MSVTTDSPAIAYLYVGEADDGQQSWWLYDENDETVAWAGKTFANTSAAEQAAMTFRTGAERVNYETFVDFLGGFHWRAWHIGDKVAASMMPFESRAAADHAVEFVRGAVGGADGP